MRIKLKKLSDYTGVHAAEIVGDLLPLVGEIAEGIDEEKLQALRQDKTGLRVLGLIVKAAPAAFLEMCRLLSEEPIEVEEMGAGELSQATFQLATDEDFLSLFGYQSKTAPSSGSVSENTEGQKM